MRVILHDSLGQYLASVKMNLALLSPYIPPDGTRSYQRPGIIAEMHR